MLLHSSPLLWVPDANLWLFIFFPSVIRAAIGMKWSTYISLQHFTCSTSPFTLVFMELKSHGSAGPAHILHLICGNFYFSWISCELKWTKIFHLPAHTPSPSDMWRFSAPFARAGENHHSAAAHLSLSSLHCTGNGNMLVLEEDGREIDYTSFLTRNRMEEAF